LLGDIIASVYDIAAETAVFQPMLPLYNGALHDKPGADEADDEDLGLPQMIALELTDADLPDYIRACDVLINATSLGWQANETPFADPPVAASTLVYDMVYRPTRLLTDAQARGARTLDGLGMLVRQGALAFTKWTGTDAPLTVMRDTLERL
jgi:shikimate 5-dehydrogenase